MGQNPTFQVGAALEAVGRELGHLGIEGMDGIDGRLDGLYVRSRLVSDEALDDFVEAQSWGAGRSSGQQDIHFDAAQGVDKFKGQRGVLQSQKTPFIR